MDLSFLVFSLCFFVVWGDKAKSKINANKTDKSALQDFLISLTGSGNGGYEDDKSNGKFSVELENTDGYGSSNQEYGHGRPDQGYGHGFRRPNQGYGHGLDGNHEGGDYGHSLHHSGYGFRPYGYGSFNPNHMYGQGYPPHGPPLIGFLVFFPDVNGYDRKRS